MSHSIHDFSAKLRQPSVAPTLETYVQWRRQVRAAREAGEPAPAAPDSSPVSLNLDLTSACNYRCAHCIDWDILNTKHRMQEQDLRSSIARMAERGLRSVILIGGGEPTLYPGFADFVAFLKQLEISVAVVTNGSRGDRLLEAAQYMDERDWIRLSLDSGSNELFTAMHRPNIPIDLDEICQWMPRIKAANPKPRLGYSYIIIWDGASRDDESLHENIHEIVSAAGRAKEYAFDYISYKPVLERQESGAEVMSPDKAAAELRAVVARIEAEVEEAKELEDERFQVYVSTNLRTLEDGTWKELSRQPKTCHMQALRQVLTPQGLYNCPAHRGVDKARIADKDGNADAERAQQTGAHLARILDDFDASHECREVTCLYHGVNWWIEDLIAGEGSLEVSPESRDYFL
jgi:wyosine [tRNA(Phe)-imidazoG37] synthetase (radical SAM superfamily)